MIAVPKRPRPHQPEPDEFDFTPVEIPLRQQLINQIAVGAVESANELRELMKRETSKLGSVDGETPVASGTSHAIWNKDGEILESLPLTATPEARAWFDESGNT
jgi:hypothetical protein